MRTTKYNSSFWPKLLPKNFKYEGKNYIHYAAELQNMEMLERAIQDKHDLKMKDAFGKNIFHFLFNDESSVLPCTLKSSSVREDWKLIDYFFLEKIINSDKWAWTKDNNVIFFKYFKKKIIETIEGNNILNYDIEKYEKVIDLFKKSILLFHKYNIKLTISEKDFKRIKFNSTIHAPVLQTSLLESENQEGCLKYLIETLKYFNTPIPIKIEKQKTSIFLKFSNDNIEFNTIVFGTTGIGKSNFLINNLLSNFVLSENQNKEELWDMWKNYIISESSLNNHVLIEKELFSLLQKNNKFIASKILSQCLKEILPKNNSDKKVFKI